jgi:hypothetical protein
MMGVCDAGRGAAHASATISVSGRPLRRGDRVLPQGARRRSPGHDAFQGQPAAPPGSGEKVMHASMRIGDATVMASDGRCQGQPNFQGFALSLLSPRFGMVADRFGVSWMVVVAHWILLSNLAWPIVIYNHLQWGGRGTSPGDCVSCFCPAAIKKWRLRPPRSTCNFRR